MRNIQQNLIADLKKVFDNDVVLQELQKGAVCTIFIERLETDYTNGKDITLASLAINTSCKNYYHGFFLDSFIKDKNAKFSIESEEITTYTKDATHGVASIQIKYISDPFRGKESNEKMKHFTIGE